MTTPNKADLAGDIAAELTRDLQHLTSVHDLHKRENSDVLPRALMSLLASVIAINYQRAGHPAILAQTAGTLRGMVEEAHGLMANMTKEEIACVNPMHPCSCGEGAANLTDDEIGKKLAEIIAGELGLPKDAVRAVKLDGREAAAVAASDNPANLAAVEKDVDEMLGRIFGTKH